MTLKLDRSIVDRLFFLESTKNLWTFTTEELDDKRVRFEQLLSKNDLLERPLGDLELQRSMACFSYADGTWNRSILLGDASSEDADYEVFFVDYGYSSEVNGPLKEASPEMWTNRLSYVIHVLPTMRLTTAQLQTLQNPEIQLKLADLKYIKHPEWPVEVIKGHILVLDQKSGSFVTINRFFGITESLPAMEVKLNEPTVGWVQQVGEETLFFMSKENEVTLEEVNDKMGDSRRNLKLLRKPKINDLVLAKFDGEYYRGRVTQVEVEQLVYFVDFGNIGKLDSPFFEMPLALTNFAPLVVETRLDSTVHNQFKHTHDQEVTITFTDREPGGVYKGHIHEANITNKVNKMNDSINETAVQAHLDSLRRSHQQHIQTYKSFKLKIMAKETNENFTIISGYTENDAGALWQLSAEIPPTEAVKAPAVEDIVVVHSQSFNASPVRGQIRQINGEAIEVFLIDYGFTEVHQVSHVYQYRSMIGKDYDRVFHIEAAVSPDVTICLTESISFCRTSEFVYHDGREVPLLKLAPVVFPPSVETITQCQNLSDIQITCFNKTDQSHETLNGRPIFLRPTFAAGEEYTVVLLNVRTHPINVKASKKDYLLSVCLKDAWEDLAGLIKDAMKSSYPLVKPQPRGRTIIVKDSEFPDVNDNGWRRGEVVALPGEETKLLKKPLHKERYLIREIDTEKCIIVSCTRMYWLPDNISALDRRLPKRIIVSVDDIEKYKAGTVHKIRIRRRRSDDINEVEFVTDPATSFNEHVEKLKEAVKENDSKAFDVLIKKIESLRCSLF